MIKPIIPEWTANNRVILIEVQNTFNQEVTNFPVFVNLGSASGQNNIDTSFVFDATTDYRNLGFYGKDGFLYAEVERWDVTGRNAQLWVNIPRLKRYETYRI